MLAVMEKQRVAEEEEIDNVRREEEKKEAIVLARRKTVAIEAAVLKVQEEENKKLSTLQMKLKALHDREKHPFHLSAKTSYIPSCAYNICALLSCMHNCHVECATKNTLHNTLTV
jgi:hypothetical protein